MGCPPPSRGGLPWARPLVWKGLVEGSVGWETTGLAKGLVQVGTAGEAGRRGVSLREAPRVPAAPRPNQAALLTPEGRSGAGGGQNGGLAEGAEDAAGGKSGSVGGEAAARPGPGSAGGGEAEGGNRTGTSGGGATCSGPLPRGRLRPGSECPLRAGWRGRRGRLPRGRHLQGRGRRGAVKGALAGRAAPKTPVAPRRGPPDASTFSRNTSPRSLAGVPPSLPLTAGTHRASPAA